MKKLKRIISPLAKKQLKELKDFNQILYGTSRANQIYFSIKDCLQVLTDFPGLGYIEPTLQDYPQCFRTFVQHSNLKIVYWIEDGAIKIAMFFGTHQKPEKLRYTIEHTSDWVCEDMEPYG
ncbi:hypothetical protein [Parabacteroides sp. AF17-3]|uniref:hypothetical protein n=1 Tax=Parabacteroides sp. AF17-3 TaxID=2293113 RepID=UPI001F34F173|nr:hypothetical protein [Parabacteroides sp. AF17-3]